MTFKINSAFVHNLGLINVLHYNRFIPFIIRGTVRGTLRHFCSYSISAQNNVFSIRSGLFVTAAQQFLVAAIYWSFIASPLEGTLIVPTEPPSTTSLVPEARQGALVFTIYIGVACFTTLHTRDFGTKPFNMAKRTTKKAG